MDLFWPERCVLCGTDTGGVPWSAMGPWVPGLRAWDRPHLCSRCAARMAPRPHLRWLADDHGGGLLLGAGLPTSGDLVALVSACKYHGVRGVSWHLGRLVAAAGRLAIPADSLPGLLPIPLHQTRERARGFNQAGLLARLTGAALGLPVVDNALRRRRATGQQAKLPALGQARGKNVAEAFAACHPPPAGIDDALLVDDLATTGKTLLAAATALRRMGWTVRGAIVAGAVAGMGAPWPAVPTGGPRSRSELLPGLDNARRDS